MHLYRGAGQSWRGATPTIFTDHPVGVVKEITGEVWSAERDLIVVASQNYADWQLSQYADDKRPFSMEKD